MKRALLALVSSAVLLSPALAQAQRLPKMKITDVRVGFPAGTRETEGDSGQAPIFKAGAWTPIFVDIVAEAPGLKGNEGRIDIVVETPDVDDVSTNYTVNHALPELPANKPFTVATFTKVASMNSDVTVSLRGPDGQTIGQPKKGQYNALDPNQTLYLTIGGRMPGLRQSLRERDKAPTNLVGNPKEDVAYLDYAADLPEHWFGYSGVDLVVLSSSRLKDFLEPFSEAQHKGRREALLEWVQRGGQIVICAGRHQNVLSDIPEIQALLPVKLGPAEPVARFQLDIPSGWKEPGKGMVTGGPGKQPPIEFAKLEAKPGRQVKVHYSRTGDRGEAPGKPKAWAELGADEQPLIVQAPYGMGRVTVVAFDLDVKPFADCKGQPEYWQWLLKESYPRPAQPTNQDNVNNRYPYGYYGEDYSNELVTQLQTHLENFEEVPVISFGWVALFILVYIVVVGPLDYFFLKKIVKRLELTWITFPAVVLVVSALAYVTAYQIKGHDLRIRKVDLVDIDLSSQQAFGNTWFTLFSPQIRHYTIGVEPSAPHWVAEPAQGPGTESVTLSWMNRPETGPRGSRSRGQSLFRRAYDYEGSATGLRGVPIQVWSTKSFSASWQAPIAGQPLASATLRKPQNDDNPPIGEITWMPGSNEKTGLPLQEAYLIYRGKVHPFPLLPGAPRKVDLLPLDAGGEALGSWLKVATGPTPGTVYYGRNRWSQQPSGVNVDQLMRAAMFFQAADRTTANQHNTSLRLLDETWRASPYNRDEVILVGRLAPQRGDAETVSGSVASPSQLWLGSLPRDGKSREKLNGTMQQETFVRIIIPIAPPPKK